LCPLELTLVGFLLADMCTLGLQHWHGVVAACWQELTRSLLEMPHSPL